MQLRGTAMINNITKNCMGTISFDAQFKGMRKPQSFIVYPIKDDKVQIIIQSDKKIGKIDVASGDLCLADDKYSVSVAKYIQTLTTEELFLLKLNIFGSATGKAGNNGMVYSDNSSALEIFGQK